MQGVGAKTTNLTEKRRIRIRTRQLISTCKHSHPVHSCQVFHSHDVDNGRYSSFPLVYLLIHFLFKIEFVFYSGGRNELSVIRL